MQLRDLQTVIDGDDGEDEHDLHVYEAALAEYHRNPVTYSLEEVERELGLPDDNKGE